MTGRVDGAQALDLVDLAYEDWDSEAWRERLIANVQRLVPGARTTGMYEYTARPVPGGIAIAVAVKFSFARSSVANPTASHGTNRR